MKRTRMERILCIILLIKARALKIYAIFKINFKIIYILVSFGRGRE
jgi:hypothetical protein